MYLQGAGGAHASNAKIHAIDYLACAASGTFAAAVLPCVC
jgi:hypothetical protein